MVHVSTVRTLSPELQAIARKELNEDSTRTLEDVEHLKKWLKKQPHLNARTDDQWLLTFLRGCKFSLERTKEKIDTYYTMRTMLPEFFSNRDPMLPEIQEILKLGNLVGLADLDDEGRRVFLLRVGVADPSKIKIVDIMKVNFMIMDIMLHEDDNIIVGGGIGMIDMKKMTLAHMTQMTPGLAKKMVKCLQEGYPMRPKGYNYVNLPGAYEAIFNLMKSFMKEKLKKWLRNHNDMESLYKEIPKRMLPTEYGGDSGSMDELTAFWKSKVESYRDWFLEDEKHKTNEKKRPGKPKTQKELFGLEGSFRQLNLD